MRYSLRFNIARVWSKRSERNCRLALVRPPYRMLVQLYQLRRTLEDSRAQLQVSSGSPATPYTSTRFAKQRPYLRTNELVVYMHGH
jgi:hypothetical protein